MRIVVGISGASGAVLAIRALEALKAMGHETHLILSDAGKMTIAAETDVPIKRVESLATRVHSNKDFNSPLASGSYRTDGMLILPCSIKTLSAVAHCYASDLLARAADVTLKEGRPLLLAVRETPLHAGHLKIMQQAAAMGAVIFPPLPAFYANLRSLEDMVDNMVGRILDRMGLRNELFRVWQGPERGEKREG